MLAVVVSDLTSDSIYSSINWSSSFDYYLLYSMLKLWFSLYSSFCWSLTWFSFAFNAFLYLIILLSEVASINSWWIWVMSVSPSFTLKPSEGVCEPEALPVCLLLILPFFNRGLYFIFDELTAYPPSSLPVLTTYSSLFILVILYYFGYSETSITGFVIY